MEKFWNERYDQESYVYGEEPNKFFQNTIDKIKAGKILLPAEGEGRNAVYAAQKGWEVEAFDISELGKEKALQLANKAGVDISYRITDFNDLPYEKESFDVIAFIYSHIPLDIKYDFHTKLLPYLKTGGHILLEGFSKNHIKFQKIHPQAGGPRDMDMLYSQEEMSLFFPDFDILLLDDLAISLSEGTAHQGNSSVIRFIGKKR